MLVAKSAKAQKWLSMSKNSACAAGAHGLLFLHAFFCFLDHINQ